MSLNTKRRQVLKTLNYLFDRNAEWAAAVKEEDPEFFTKLVKQQSPELL